MRLSLIVFTLIFASSVFADAKENSAAGFFVSNRSFETDFTLHRDIHPVRIQDYIESANPSSWEYAQELSEEILHVSSCLGVDAVFMTALIHKESTFYPTAASRTGAAGLTQLTGAALNEFKDQLGLRGKGRARTSNTRHLKRTLSQCMGADEYEKFLWTVASSSNSAIKSKVKKKRIWGLYIGASVLKVYLAEAQDNLGYADLKTIYAEALEQYNGDVHKARYAKLVAMYAKEFNELF